MRIPSAFLAIFTLLSFPSISVDSHAQSSTPAAVKIPISYQSPENGDTYVPRRTTIALRPGAVMMTGRSAEDFSFDVRGDISGSHSGEIVIADDQRTVIFKPNTPFTLGENVSVRFAFVGENSLQPYNYVFQITHISDSEQFAVVNTLRRQERSDLEAFAKKNGVSGRLTPMIGVDSLVGVVDTIVPGKVAPGYIFCAQAGGGTQTNLSFLAILDNTGSPAFLYNEPSLGYLNFRAYLNNAMSYFRVDTILFGSGEGGKGIVLDTNFNPIDSFECGNGYIANEHEFQYLRKHHAYMIAYDTRDTDMRIVTGDPNASKHAYVVGGVIQELDSKKNVIFQWRSWDHFKITDMVRFDPSNPNHSVFDYTHLNSVRQDTDGNILASFNAMDEVTKIDFQTGKVLWRFGGKNNYFTFKGDTVMFSGQHDAHSLSNGHLIMMDNGIDRKVQWGDGTYHDTIYSRVIEYDIDPNSLTATALWQYDKMPPTFAGGNVQRLKNGNTFIGLGAVSIPNAIEITPDGEKVFQMSFYQGGFSYRTFRYEYPITSTSGLSAPIVTKSGDSPVIESIYPNPVQNTATLTFSSVAEGPVRIEIINTLGQQVYASTENFPGSGSHSTELDLGKLRSGSYYCRLEQAGRSSMKLIVVAK